MSPPHVPGAKHIDVCSTQEKKAFLSQLNTYSKYLDGKIMQARLNDEQQDNCNSVCGCSNDDDLVPSQGQAGCNSDTTSITDGSEDPSTRDSCEDSFIYTMPSESYPYRISLAPPSPFDSQPFRYLFKPQDDEINNNTLSINASDSTIPAAQRTPETALETVNDAAANKLSGSDANLSLSWTTSPDSWGLHSLEEHKKDAEHEEGHNSQEAQEEPNHDYCYPEEDEAIPAAQQSNVQYSSDHSFEKLRDDAWDALSTADNRISQLQYLIHMQRNDDFVRNITAEVSAMSQRLMELIDQTE